MPDLELGDSTETKEIGLSTSDVDALYIGNNKFLTGKKTHTELLNEYLEENEEPEQIAFCYIQDGALIIDADAEMIDCTFDEVAKAAQSNGCDKVYAYSSNDNTIKRIANRINRKRDTLLRKINRKLGKRGQITAI